MVGQQMKLDDQAKDQGNRKVTDSGIQAQLAVLTGAYCNIPLRKYRICRDDPARSRVKSQAPTTPRVVFIHGFRSRTIAFKIVREFVHKVAHRFNRSRFNRYRTRVSECQPDQYQTESKIKNCCPKSSVPFERRVNTCSNASAPTHESGRSRNCSAHSSVPM